MRKRMMWALLALTSAGVAVYGVQRETSAIAAMEGEDADGGGASTSAEGSRLEEKPDAGEAKQALGDAAKVNMVLRELHAINHSEIESGRLASERAQAAEIKDFAELMVRDHTEADRKLTDFAKRNSIDLTKATPVDPIHVALDRAEQAQQKALGTKRGAAFDAAYIAPQVLEHRVALSIAEEGRKYAKDEAKTLLDETYRMLGEHLARAERLQSQLRFEPAAIGGGPEQPKGASDADGGEGLRFSEDAGTQGTGDSGPTRVRPPPVDGREEPSD